MSHLAIDLAPVLSSRQAMRGILFDELPPTWLIDRRCRILDANAEALTVAASGEPVVVVDAHLSPSIVGGARRFAMAVAMLAEEAFFSWPDRDGRDTSLRLRFVDVDGVVAATLVRQPDPLTDIAPRLEQRLGISLRQSQLAAHLLLGHTLSGAAVALGISRTTANEYLGALQRRVGTSGRPALLAKLLSFCF